MSNRQNGQTAQPTANAAPSADHVREMLRPGVDENLPQPLKNLLAKDFPLSNIDANDREFFRLKSKNIRLYLSEEFPPQDSLVTGVLGAALLEQPGYDVQPLTPRRKTEFETILDDSYARSSRGVSGWQQEEFSKSTNVRRVEDNRTPEDGGGMLGDLFS
jgi:hypothetical protein